MIRVVQLTVGLEWGGAENLLAGLCPLLDRAEFDVRVLALKGDGPVGEKLRREGVPVAALGGSRWDPRLPLRLRAALKEAAPDIVHSHQLRGSLLAAAFKEGFALVWHEHSLGDWMGPLLRAAERRFLPAADLVLAGSEKTAGLLAARAPAAKERLRVLPNGVDTDFFSPRPPEDRDVLRKEFWGAGPQDPVVGFVGRLGDPVKGAADLLRAASLLRARHPRARVVLVGPPEGLRAAVPEGAVLAGPRPHAALPAVYAGFDLFALPSRSEASSIALMEAMACGLPVVATAVGGTPEIVADGETGRLVPPGDPEAFAAAAGALLADPALRARLGEAGRRRVEERFSLGEMAQRLAAIYRELRQTEKR